MDSDTPRRLDLERARKLVDAGKLAEALQICEARLKEHAPTAAVYHLMGVVHEARGDGAAAADLYRRAIYLDPGHRDSLSRLARYLAREGDVDTADDLRKHLQTLDARAGR